MTPERAQALAIDALAWLAREPDRLGGLMGAAGLDLAELRRRAAEPEFLGFVVDWLMQDEDAAAAFAAEVGLREDGLRRLRAALPGGETPDWT